MYHLAVCYIVQLTEIAPRVCFVVLCYQNISANDQTMEHGTNKRSEGEVKFRIHSFSKPKIMGINS